MSFQEEELWEEESDTRFHPVVRRMALFHLSSPRRSDEAVGEGRCRRGLAGDTGAGFCFLLRNSSLRLTFLLMVDGLGFFLLSWVSEASTFVSTGEGEVGAH